MTSHEPEQVAPDHGHLAPDPWAANAQFWITIIRDKLDRYRNELTDPAMLTAIGPCDGQRILDAGCGEGYLSRAIATRGASEVVGIDTCEPLIEAATTAAAGLPNATFTVADIEKVPYPDAYFDLVVAN